MEAHSCQLIRFSGYLAHLTNFVYALWEDNTGEKTCIWTGIERKKHGSS